MHVTRSGRRARVLAVIAAAAVLGTLLVTPGPIAQAADPPPNPSDGQISSAQQQKTALAGDVGRLSAEVASMQTQLQQLAAERELAEQKVALALSKLRDARTAATAANKAVAVAQTKVDAAEAQFRAYAQAAYMSGSLGGTTGSLLTAQDPSALLQQSALEGYESDHQIDAVGRLQSATVAKSNADAAARLAVQQRADAAAASAKAEREASSAVLAARAQARQVQSSLAASQTQLHTAQEHLATLNHQRVAYLAYQKKQAAIRRARELARQRAIARAERLAAERARQLAALRARRERARQLAAERARAERARLRHEHHGGGSGGSGSGGGSSSGGGGGGSGSGGGGSGSGGGSSSGGSGGGSAGPPRSDGWSAAKGRYAVRRAERYLGWSYSWAAGNSSGPTYGVCAGDGAWNDCHVIGFDCSGLTIYGWAPYLSMAHYAASQYYQAGSYHPSTSDLRPGDLVFWSTNGTVAGIEHVAMYIGNGNVIQAPQSGDVIKITNLYNVEWGYYGATRPLT